jgi:hypothetical protein
MFASTNDFNNFLNEIDALYRRSVGHWGDYLSSIQTQALRNNQTPLVNADSTITESTLPGQMEENFSDQDRQPAQ